MVQRQEDPVRAERNDLQKCIRANNLLKEVENLLNENQIDLDNLSLTKVKLQEMKFWMGKWEVYLVNRISRYG